MAIRTAHAIWEGNLRKGKGELDSGSGALKGSYTFASRFENGKGTNPEELIGAAHAGCFSMAFANLLDEKGFSPNRVETTANVNLEKDQMGPKITWIELIAEADVPGIDEEQFRVLAYMAKKNCPISRALASTEIRLTAKLVGVPVKV
jgi:lipoyl-dependent peroxiredoxin